MYMNLDSYTGYIQVKGALIQKIEEFGSSPVSIAVHEQLRDIDSRFQDDLDRVMASKIHELNKLRAIMRAEAKGESSE